jgi:hypothetical protein
VVIALVKWVLGYKLDVKNMDIEVIGITFAIYAPIAGR